MEENKSSDVLSDKDIEVLFISFPDLKQKFQDNVGKKEILSFMDKVADECGVEHGTSQVLEYVAVAAAMKLRAKIALGELESSDLAFLSPDRRDDIMQKAETFKNSAKSATPVVDRGICQDIKNMDFDTAISVLPLQDKLTNQFFHEKLSSEDAEKFLMREDLYKFTNLTMISGNETGGGRSLEKDEFTTTVERRLTNGAVENGDENDIFKTFSGLSLTAHALQCRAAIELGKTFPESVGEIEKNSSFFRKHAPETLAMCQICQEQGFKLENVKQMKDLVGSSVVKDFAYGSYAPVFDFYADTANIKTGRCPISCAENTDNPTVCLPQRLPKNQESENVINFVRMVTKDNKAQNCGNNILKQGRTV